MSLRFLERVGEKLALRYGMEVARGYLLKRLEKATPQLLYEAIKEGREILLSERDAKMARKLRRFHKYLDKVDVGVVLKWLSIDRPDLASVIEMTPGGVDWLSRELGKIKKSIST